MSASTALLDAPLGMPTPLVDAPHGMPEVAIITGDAVMRRRLQDTLRAATVRETDLDRADVMLFVCEGFRKPEAELVRVLLRRQPDAEVLVLSRTGDAATSSAWPSRPAPPD